MKKRLVAYPNFKQSTHIYNSGKGVVVTRVICFRNKKRQRVAQEILKGSCREFLQDMRTCDILQRVKKRGWYCRLVQNWCSKLDFLRPSWQTSVGEGGGGEKGIHRLPPIPSKPVPIDCFFDATVGTASSNDQHKKKLDSVKSKRNKNCTEMLRNFHQTFL
jgi:hypothetical protein